MSEVTYTVLGLFALIAKRPQDDLFTAFPEDVTSRFQQFDVTDAVL